MRLHIAMSSFYFKELGKIIMLKKPRNMVIFKLYLPNDQKLR